MIRINLLPVDLRKSEKLPIAQIFVSVVGGTVLAVVAIVWGYLNFFALEGLKQQLEGAKTALADVQKEAKRYDELLAYIKKHQDKEAKVAELWQERYLWGERLDQLIHLVPTFIGFTDLRLDEPRMMGGARQRDNQATSAGTLSIKGISAGKESRRVGVFEKILKGIPMNEFPEYRDLSIVFSRDMQKLTRETTTLVTAPTRDDVEERNYYEFEMKLELKSKGEKETPAPTARSTTPAAS